MDLFKQMFFFVVWLVENITSCVPKKRTVKTYTASDILTWRKAGCLITFMSAAVADNNVGSLCQVDRGVLWFPSSPWRRHWAKVSTHDFMIAVFAHMLTYVSLLTATHCSCCAVKWILLPDNAFSLVYIDGTDAASEGTFVSSQTGAVLSYFNWHSGEPNDCCTASNCINLYRSNGQWNDIQCDRLLPSVCEIDMSCKFMETDQL